MRQVILYWLFILIFLSVPYTNGQEVIIKPDSSRSYGIFIGEAKIDSSVRPIKTAWKEMTDRMEWEKMLAAETNSLKIERQQFTRQLIGLMSEFFQQAKPETVKIRKVIDDGVPRWNKLMSAYDSTYTDSNGHLVYMSWGSRPMTDEEYEMYCTKIITKVIPPDSSLPAFYRWLRNDLRR